MRSRDDIDRLEEAHEINVTPFIDVMLVLLIIFMVAAPLATVDMPVDLPASSAERKERPKKPVYLSLDGGKSVALGNEPVERDALPAALAKATDGDTDRRIFLRADKQVEYGAVMDLLNLLRDNGYLKVALVGLEGAAAAP
ncbi:biopolymer transport protein ExbD [Parvibaculum indicum]|nr:biopolymer transport protein ExbD [Parvibaculum indicum]